MKIGTLLRLARFGMLASLATAGAACGGDDDSGSVDAGTPGDDAGAADAASAADAGGDAAPAGPLDATGGFAGPRRAGSTHQALPPASPFRALQLNLCNSGYAGCFQDGLAIPEGHDVITQVSPHVVTLNEICEDDVSTQLFAAMQEAWPDDYVFWAFAPAASRDSGGPITCTDGQRYGVGILGHVPAASWAGFEFAGSRLENQSADNEMRAWACAYAADNYYICATHLENDNGDVAIAQCNEVMNPIIPEFWGTHGGQLPTVLGGDFNLRFNGSPDVQDCVPQGWYRKGDGDVQHIMATSDLVFESSEAFSMERTDHDAWLIRVVTP